MRKLLSIIIALGVMLSLSVGASAEENNPTGQKITAVECTSANLSGVTYNNPKYLIDGDLNTFTELNGKDGYLQIDLGAAYVITHIDISTRNGTADGLDIRLSNDKSFAVSYLMTEQISGTEAYKTHTFDNNDIDNSYRYIKLYVNSSIINRYRIFTEITAYGYSVNGNIALGKPVTTNYKNGTNINDGNAGTYWDPWNAGTAQWAVVDLENNFDIHSVVLGFRGYDTAGNISEANNMDVYASSDNEEWVKIGDTSCVTTRADDYRIILGDSNSYRYIKVAQKNANTYSLVSEIFVYTKNNANAPRFWAKYSSENTNVISGVNYIADRSLPSKPLIILAVYDKDGMLKQSCITADRALVKDGKAQGMDYAAGNSISVETDDIVKVFVWDSLDSLNPLVKAAN